MTLAAFFVLTFAVTWTAWLGGAALAARSHVGLFGIGGPLFLFGVFAPALVAISMTARRDGRAGVWRLIAGIGRWRVSGRWYLFAMSYMAVTKLLAAAAQRLATGGWPAFGTTPWPLLLAATLTSAWAQAGEEIGWRGYALPRLTPLVGLGGASALLGVIWACWHLPLFFMPGTGSDGQSFPIYLLHVSSLSVILAWVYWKTGRSLLLVMLMHASVNNTTEVVPAALPTPAGTWSFHGSFVAWATVSLAWLLAASLLFAMRRVRSV
jgi:membrane protease YdiL (CAAX protease family)